MASSQPCADCWFLTGPTASGKTRVGIELARRLNAEIVSLDSMALYRGMDVGTAKPSPSERAAVPHHLVDVIDPSQEFSVAQYVEAAEQVAAQIKQRGREVLFVGGTPLYLKALLRGLFVGPPADWVLRAQLAEIAERLGAQSLHDRLAVVDPASARRLHPSDTRRIIRAIEVYEKTGRPISEHQRQFDQARPASACRVFVLDWPRDELCAHIDLRVDMMFAAGFVDEVRGLVAGGRSLSRTASQAVGYREVFDYLAGQLNLDDTQALIKTRTRQFAKRQLTWFRSLSECHFLPMKKPVDTTALIQQIADLGTKATSE